MVAASGVTPLSVNLESMTANPGADGGSKNGVPWKDEKAMCHFVHIDKVTTDCFGVKEKRDNRRRAA